MNKALRWHLTIGLAAFLVGLAVFAPASLLESSLQKALAGNGSFRPQGGTLWAGSGTLTAGKMVIPLSWRFDAAALLRLRLGINVNFDSAALRGNARISRGLTAVVVRDADLKADLTALAPWVPALALTRSAGNLQLRTADGDQLELYPGDALPLRGNFDLGVENFVWPQWSTSVLGSYTFHVNAVEGVADFTVAKSAGLLQLEGGGALRSLPAREFVFKGTAAPTRPGTQLPALLATVGTAGKDGRTTINFSSPW